ncbi:sigma-54-dependent Fis family transcriptional regulator [Rhodoferax sp.]|uniref:sigma-54-dependent Fis family transcriptional regulator n=1 Tax=Rhodoferax sp. TaxID=50421 RepID=UPI00261C0765|nr:sigma-54-dependent Fis family transcriptional regulator [Rhodoferax sp.]MDD4941929.1 sigma 54-interacting transcriptional regulator [Rhodoferax sp.]MDD5480036.1 sigma 54-interacting transcriptional regulator [Rhodoferax sp.]
MSFKYPPDKDLRRLLRFEPDSGAIWLGDRRMVLMHTAALAALRQDLINSVGTEHARRILTRMGYASGLSDAEYAKKTRPGESVQDSFLVGPQLHMLEGAARVTPVKITFDIAAGLFNADFRCDDSWEAYAHRQKFGLVDEPSCWTLLGYASGYTSAFMGRLILYKETLCAACGADHCQIVGRPIEEWPDGEAHRVYFTDDSLMDKMEALQSQVEALKSTLEPVSLGGQLIGDSLGFRKAYTLMQKVAPTQATVLLTGETGVGKERFARALHELSNRADKPFVAVNCAALPAELIEAELFGVEKGAYTGAHAARAGRFERADGGTLLLDEVGEMPMAAQTKLLRVLQEGEIERVGGETTRKVNVRLVAATNVDLAQAVQAGRFRADLMYRLNVYPICIPPLRERKADIEPLAQAMLARFCALHGKRVMGIEERALQALRQHDWPGNVRELENLIERGVILATQAGMVEVEHLFPNQPDTAQTGLNANGQLVRLPSAQDDDLSTRILNSGSSLDEIEARVLDHAVARASGNLSEAARLLGLTRPQLAYRLKRQHASEADAPASKPAQE